MFWLKKISIYLKGWLQTLENFIWLKKPVFEDFAVFDDRDKIHFFKDLTVMFEFEENKLAVSKKISILVFEAGKPQNWTRVFLTKSQLNIGVEFTIFDNKLKIKMLNNEVFLGYSHSFDINLAKYKNWRKL